MIFQTNKVNTRYQKMVVSFLPLCFVFHAVAKDDPNIVGRADGHKIH